MSYEKWRNISIKILLILVFASILLFAFSFVSHSTFTGKSLAETYDIPLGESLFAGDGILGDNEVMKVPLISNMNFLVHQVVSMDLSGLLLSLTTGVVPFDLSTVSSGGIDAYGKASGFEGPGHLTLDGDNLVVKAPDAFIWGYSIPYKVLTKTSTGVDVVENGTVVSSLSESQLNSSNFGNDYYNMSDVYSWYNSAGEGNNYTLERGVANFSDNRSDINPNQVNDLFGKNISDYVAAYPDGSVVMVYMGNVSEVSGEDYYTSLGSHPEYGDNLRAFNAKSFVNAWNNTVIPPNSTANGKDYVNFETAKDSTAPGGGACHGVCPPARALRAATLGEGFSLPVGMVTDEDAVMFGFNPSEDIKITNDFDYAVKIIMWYEGSGTGMVLHAKMVKYVPT